MLKFYRAVIIIKYSMIHQIQNNLSSKECSLTGFWL